MSKHLIIAVHGIRDYGLWQDELRSLVTSVEPDALVEPYRYGYFSAIGFIIPPVRWMAARRFHSALAHRLASGYWDRVDIVAHSFGTYIVAHSLLRLKRTAPERPLVDTVIFAGAALSDTFPVQKVIPSVATRLVNDCGIYDVPLILSQIAGPGMAGRVGLRGLQSISGCLNRYFPYGHGDYFERDGKQTDHMSKYWVPLLTSQDQLTWPADPRRHIDVVKGLFEFLLNNVRVVRGPLLLVLLLMLCRYELGLLRDDAQQRKIAAQQAQLAAQEKRTAESRRLSQVSGFALDSDPSMALEYAIEAAQSSPTDESAHALGNALDRSHLALTVEHKEGAIDDSAYSPDGTRIATIGGGRLKEWSANNGALLRSIDSGDADQLSFGSDGQLLFFRRGGTLKVVSRDGLTFTVPEKGVEGAAFLKNTNRVAIAGNPEHITLWDYVKGRKAGAFRADTKPDPLDPLTRAIAAPFMPPSSIAPTDFGEVYSLSISDDESTIATAGADGVITWNTRTGKAKTVAGHCDPSSTIVLGKGADAGAACNAAVLLAGSWANKYTEPAENTSDAPQARDDVDALAFAEASDELLVGTKTGAVKVWRPGSTDRRSICFGRRLCDEDMAGGVSELVVSPSGDEVAVSWEDGSLAVGRIQTDFAEHRPNVVFRLYGYKGTVKRIAFSPDGKRLLTTHTDGTTRIWSLNDYRASIQVPAREGAHRIVVSPDRTEFALLYSQPESSRHEEGPRYSEADDDAIRPQRWSVEVRDTHDLHLLYSFPFKVDGLRFSPDGLQIGVVRGKSLSLFRTRTGEQLPGGIARSSPVVAFSFSPGGESLLTVARDGVWLTLDDGTVQWKAATPSKEPSVRGDGALPLDPIVCGFSHVTSRVALADSYWLEVLDAHTGAKLFRTPIEVKAALGALGPAPAELSQAAFTPDDTRIIVTSYDVPPRLYRATNGVLFEGFESEPEMTMVTQDQIEDIRFAPDGKWALLASPFKAILCEAEQLDHCQRISRLNQQSSLRANPFNRYTEFDHFVMEFSYPRFAFSADSKAMVGIGDSIGIWKKEKNTWRLDEVIGGYWGDNVSEDMVSDGSAIIALGTDGIIRRFPLSPSELLVVAQSHTAIRQQ